LEKLIEDGAIPAGGLKAMQDAIKGELRWVVDKVDPMVHPSHSVYRRIQKAIISALYVFAIQGRVLAFTKFTVEDCARALGDQFAVMMRKEFKTSMYYGYQPITIAEIVKPAMAVLFQIRSRMKTASQAFFISYKGNELTSSEAGHMVTSEMASLLGVHTTTTKIRMLFEVMATKAHDEGLITGTDRRAVQMVNGHNCQTTKQYYAKRCRLDDARRGVNVLQTIMEHELPLVDDPDAHVLVSGTQHEYVDEPNKKAPWTDFEIETVGLWISRLLQDRPNLKFKAVQLCLEHIRGNEQLRQRFHPFHIVDSNRLRYAWITWKRQYSSAVRDKAIALGTITDRRQHKDHR
jgi:hypothetical protein